MAKTILITGASDGIGLETAKALRVEGAHLLLHGRSPRKLEDVAQRLCAISGSGSIQTYVADLSRLPEVVALADQISSEHQGLDVLINNAGVLSADSPVLEDGQDIRFVVNTLAPYVLTRRLLPLLRAGSRVVNVSSAAQSPVYLKALAGNHLLDERAAYAQSKLALNMWSVAMAAELGDRGPMIVAVNPASLLGSKMVKDAFGIDGGSLQIGADILARAARSDEFAGASGKYYDNDKKAFADPHADAMDRPKTDAVVAIIETLVAQYLH